MGGFAHFFFRLSWHSITPKPPAFFLRVFTCFETCTVVVWLHGSLLLGLFIYVRSTLAHIASTETEQKGECLTYAKLLCVEAVSDAAFFLFRW